VKKVDEEEYDIAKGAVISEKNETILCEPFTLLRYCHRQIGHGV